MAYIRPARVKYEYAVMRRPDGDVFEGVYADGGTYFNVVANRINGGVPSVRIIARTRTLEAAESLVKALTEHTQ